MGLKNAMRDDGLEELVPEAPSEDSMAEEFARLHADTLKHLAESSRWLQYRGGVWAQEHTLLAFDLARGIARNRAERDAEERELAAPARARLEQQLRSAKTIAAIERLARADRAHAVTLDQLDRHAELLNTPGGEVYLPTGELVPHDPAHLHTKQTAVTPALGRPETWLRFLDRACGSDQALIDYLQRLAGYALLGRVVEHVLPFVWGPGGNGKSIFLTTLSGILGSYAVAAPMSTFVEQHGTSHPTELAMLAGARLVTASETEAGQRFAMARVKQLTGGDPVSARFMRGDFFTFQPQFLLVLSGNSKPSLANVDEGMRRRLHMVPFTAAIPPSERDPHLADKLRPEWPQILQWMISGFLAWQAQGLNPPAAVLTSTDAYLDQEDTIGAWLKDATTSAKDAQGTLSSKLWADYSAWAAFRGDPPITNKRLSRLLSDRGHPNDRAAAGTCFLTLALKPERERPWAAPQQPESAPRQSE